jgi:hypothetical protein
MQAFDVSSAMPEQHTMGLAKQPYVVSKIHYVLRERNDIERVVVRAHYDRHHGDPLDSIISRYEKTDKRFNFKRPTVTLENENGLITAYVNCYPGWQYVFHYYALIGTYYREYKSGKKPKLDIVLPDFPGGPTTALPSINSLTACEEIGKTNLHLLPRKDFVIMGYVEQLHGLTNSAPFTGEGDFQWSEGEINGYKIALLGFNPSFWGDIAGSIVKVLAEQGHGNLIYVGKMGSMDPAHVPNRSIGTGSSSIGAIESISWKNLFDSVAAPNIFHGQHAACIHVLSETFGLVSMYQQLGCSFIEPEVYPMAYYAAKGQMGFGYMNLVSDNLLGKYAHNLTTERLPEVRRAREALFYQIQEIIKQTLFFPSTNRHPISALVFC